MVDPARAILNYIARCCSEIWQYQYIVTQMVDPEKAILNYIARYYSVKYDSANT